MKRFFTYGAFIFLFFNYMLFLGNTSGSVAGFTGAPGESTCGVAGCHNVMNNLGDAIAAIEFDSGADQYTPGETYSVNVSLTDAKNANKNGFQIVALDNQEESVGTWTADTGNKVINNSSRSYVTHNFAGSSSTSWDMQWTAPDNYAGPVSFYAALNDVNGNGMSSGDDVYTTQMDITSPSASVNAINGLRSLRAFPSPFNDAFTISLENSNSKNVTIDLYSRSGKYVMQLWNNTVESGKQELYFDNLAYLPKDVYFVRIREIDGGTNSLKLIKI